ncbi:MAG: ATP-binding cassette domain-containing protein [Promethearchaeota archaeon]|nr:MAG: ATP-binding cassette domain-containing protein [Candidatus Lokiarchaeota archaeon]
MRVIKKLDAIKKSNLIDLNIEKEVRRNILKVNNLKTYFNTEEGIVKAVDGVSFDMYENEILGLVGETGCGKSVTALSILQLVRNPGKIIDGEIMYKNLNLLELSEEEIRKFRGNQITMIFQDPLNSLNPVLTIEDQIQEVFKLHQKEEMRERLEKEKLEYGKKVEELRQLEDIINEKNLNIKNEEKLQEKLAKLKRETRYIPRSKFVLREEAIKIIKEVGIADPQETIKRYPHELSGGMRQRVMIAMAISCNPSLLIADEPTTALDVTIQAQILDLLKKLQNKYKTSILLITHDLGIIAETSDRVAVMYSGHIVETGPTYDLFNDPCHPYTKGLIEAIPTMNKKFDKLKTIRGTVPNLIYPPSGCRFHPRCDHRLEICDKKRPSLIKVKENHYVACHLFHSEYKKSPKYQWSKEELNKTSLV